MPTLKISAESMALLIAEARRLGITVKDVADALISETLGEGEELEEEEEEEEESEEED